PPRPAAPDRAAAGRGIPSLPLAPARRRAGRPRHARRGGGRDEGRRPRAQPRRPRRRDRAEPRRGAPGRSGGRRRGVLSERRRRVELRGGHGADLIWISGPDSVRRQAYAAVLAAARAGKIPRARIDEAAIRILAVKGELGLGSKPLPKVPKPAGLVPVP